MNVYDFDGTLYNGDSTLDFWWFSLRRHPKVLLSFPKALWSGIRYRFFHGSLENFKAAFFGFLPSLPNAEMEVRAFWDKHQKKIFSWYLEQKQADDVIISASPGFLVEECCKRLGVDLIATHIDMKTGELQGQNCKGEEKVRRYQEKYTEAVIEKFYSDSFSDTPMAVLAQQSFFVKNGKIIPWENVCGKG